MNVHRIELDEENLKFLLLILKDAIITRKQLANTKQAIVTTSYPEANLQVLGAATMIRDNIIDQTGIKQ